MTVTLLARHLNLRPSQCASLIRKLTHQRFLCCLNPTARSCRVHWLTKSGLAAQRKVYASQGLTIPTPVFPDTDWALYGWASYRHRAAIIKVLTQPLQPPAVKRRVRLNDSNARMSDNNVREVLYLFVAKGIARKMRLKRKAHSLYELTELGHALRQLLAQAETPIFNVRRHP